LNWAAIYGSSNRVAPGEGLVIERFTHRAAQDFQINHHAKAFVKPTACASQGTCKNRGEPGSGGIVQADHIASRGRDRRSCRRAQRRSSAACRNEDNDPPTHAPFHRYRARYRVLDRTAAYRPIGQLQCRLSHRIPRWAQRHARLRGILFAPLSTSPSRP
jgi:hypothetical protein